MQRYLNVLMQEEERKEKREKMGRDWKDREEKEIGIKRERKVREEKRTEK